MWLRRVPRTANGWSDDVTALSNGPVDSPAVPRYHFDRHAANYREKFLDITTALTAHALEWLSQHREERTRLSRNRDTLINPATEEFLRYFTPAPGDARTISEDMDVSGAKLHEGERVWLSWAMANRDPALFDDPDRVRL